MDKVLPEDSPAREYMANALRSSLCGADLTRHLLAFSRQQPLQPELVDVNRLLRGTTKLLNRTLGEAIEINVVEDNVNWLALVDPSQLEAAILNLAVNARDAMPDGGTLTLSISWRSLPAGFTDDGVKFVAGDYVVVEVIDTGTGMTPEVKSHAFEPFYTTKPVNKGSGLGLAMVYGFLKQSGGHVVISSEVGHGTSVRLYLPRATESCLNAHSPQLPAVVRLDKSGGETILVVEDNEPIRKLMQHQLKDIGYKVLVAENALMALEIMVANPKLDLLLTDIVMPGGMTGIDLARIFKDRWPEVKIVLCTGSIDESQLRESSALGLITLNKPYRPADLNRKLRLALDN
ncbi:MAG: ATP-binding protein, partial [Rhodospirillaceae bacterium]